MKENLPQKYKDNIFYRLFRKIRLLFFKEKEISSEVQQLNYQEIKNNTQKSESDFMEQIRVKSDYKNPETEKKEFMQNLTDNPELLENFSNDRLEKILQYYLDENDKKRELLKKLTA